MGLDTLDETKPRDTDLVSSGDDEIRLTRAATKQSFGLEHHLAGYHKFIVGPVTSRPAPGHVGRLFINSSARNIEYDNGTAWIPTQLDPGVIVITSSSQLNLFSTIWAQSEPEGHDLPTNIPDNVERVQAEVEWSSRGGPWLCWASVVGQYPVTMGGFPRNSPRFVARLRLDSPAGVATGGTILQAAVQELGLTANPPGDIPSSYGLIFPFSSSLLACGSTIAPEPNTTLAGVHRLTLTSQAIDFAPPDPTGLFPSVNSRRLIVMEQA